MSCSVFTLVLTHHLTEAIGNWRKILFIKLLFLIFELINIPGQYKLSLSKKYMNIGENSRMVKINNEPNRLELKKYSEFIDYFVIHFSFLF